MLKKDKNYVMLECDQIANDHTPKPNNELIQGQANVMADIGGLSVMHQHYDSTILAQQLSGYGANLSQAFKLQKLADEEALRSGIYSSQFKKLATNAAISFGIHEQEKILQPMWDKPLMRDFANINNFMLSLSLENLGLRGDIFVGKVVDAWTELQTQQPLVHCITNSVAANYAANILLAAGASPAMIDNPFEAESFASIAAALSINLGTPTSEQMQAMQISAQTVAINNLGALAGNQVESKGVDSAVSSNEVYLQAQALLNHCECVAISGESDFVLSKELHHVIQINGGSFLQPKVTATGCALGALIAAYSAVTLSYCTILQYSLALRKIGLKKARLWGIFNVAFLDEIYQMSANKIWEYSDTLTVLGLII
ncbi:hypothetical protein FQR65_LT16322 [Abscondita terminalis]|nr:hypothetical protein FQR65_LT16322 [Abscondita terminalis]